MIKDSGERTEFQTGAVRDMRAGKGRCDLMPLSVVAEVMDDGIIRDVARFQTSGDWRDLSGAILRFAHERKWSVHELMLEK